MPAANDAPYFYPKKFLALLPAVYAWQVYGWKVALSVYVLAIVLLAFLSWLYYAREWSARQLIWARTALLLLSMAAVGVSAMEMCNADGSACHRVFWPN